MILKCHSCKHLLLREYIDDNGLCEKCFLKKAGLRRCTKCHIIKSEEAFRTLPAGFKRSFCRVCENRKQKERDQKNGD